jgi:Ca2+-binding EF-hand superfamily protein|tara:strand:+ start:2051 stop:2383 length:333 start_codon:yes stop_codon:yes gene_type:complete
MFFLLILTLLTSITACPSKNQALICFYQSGDLNHDNYIDKNELLKMIDTYLPWYERYPFKLFGGIDQILKDCDADKDGRLTKAEAIQMKTTCLNTCYKRSMTISTFGCKI